MIRIVIADDHDLIRRGLVRLVEAERDISIIGEASSAGELTALLQGIQPDVVLLDINLPDRSGLEVLKDLHQTMPRIRILMLSMHPENRYARRAMLDGAAGYLCKDSAGDDLITAIRQVYTRGRYVSPAVAEELASYLQTSTGDAPHSTLSDREYQLLLLLGNGMSVRDAAGRLGVSPNTVHTYRRRLMRKMSLHTDTELVRYTITHKLVE